MEKLKQLRTDLESFEQLWEHKQQGKLTEAGFAKHLKVAGFDGDHAFHSALNTLRRQG